MSWSWSPQTQDAVARFLADRLLLTGPLTLTRIGDGHSNLTFRIDGAEGAVVLRRPPPPPLAPGAHDVLREARLLSALKGSAAPTPEVLATAAAGEVLDVPFYVMTFVPGEVFTTDLPFAEEGATERRSRMVEAMADALATLHATDWRARGLHDFGRPEDFNRRHLARIRRLVEDGGGRAPEPFEAIYAALTAAAPAEAGATILHNDFRLGNLMWARGAPDLIAILDWELATLGDPLFDVGYAVASLPCRDGALTPTQDLATALHDDALNARAVFLRRYADRTGRELAGLSWYVAAVNWKLAVLYDYSRRRGEDVYYATPDHTLRFLAAAKQALASGVSEHMHPPVSGAG